MKLKEKISISKCKRLIHMLRHSPDQYGIVLDQNGWANVVKVMSVLNLTFNELFEIVDTNDKKRFEFNKGNTLIRACQGHSIEIDLDLREAIPPRELYHGTCMNFTPNIDDFGLNKMNRNHVHLSDNPQIASNVGSRHGVPFVYGVRALDMHKDGFKFYLSNNGVWLTEHVPSKYLVR